MSSKVVCNPPGLQPSNQARPRETTCGHRHAVKASIWRQRRKRQHEPNPPSPSNLRKNHRPPLGSTPSRYSRGSSMTPCIDGRLEMLKRSREGWTRNVPKRRQNSHTTGRNTQTTNLAAESRHANTRTPRTRPHHRPPGKTLLVARPKEMDGRIHLRLCHMSAEQTAHTPVMNPIIPHHDQRRDPPLSDSSNGSYYKPAH